MSVGKSGDENNQDEDISSIIDIITQSCSKNYFRSILKRLLTENKTNAEIICNYIKAEETEQNIKNSTKKTKIRTLSWLSEYRQNKNTFFQMQKQDIISYLNANRKSIYNPNEVLHRLRILQNV